MQSFHEDRAAVCFDAFRVSLSALQQGNLGQSCPISRGCDSCDCNASDTLVLQERERRVQRAWFRRSPRFRSFRLRPAISSSCHISALQPELDPGTMGSVQPWADQSGVVFGNCVAGLDGHGLCFLARPLREGPESHMFWPKSRKISP